MAPIYDYTCPSCKKETSFLQSYTEYDASTKEQCSECKGPLTKKDRILGRGLKTIVTGPGKGNHNSNDWS